MKLNKDGTPRMKGSGRPKGSVSFTSFTLKQLSEQLPEGARIVVSRVWADHLNLAGGDIATVTARSKIRVSSTVAEEPSSPISVQEINFDDM